MSCPRLYSLEYLQRFQDNVLVHARYSAASDQDKQYTYSSVLHQVQEVCRCLVRLNVPEYSGIAIDIQEHTVDTLTLLLRFELLLT